MSGTAGLLGWSWIFVGSTSCRVGLLLDTPYQILEGILTFVVGLVACLSKGRLSTTSCITDELLVLADFPDTAKFLSEEERAFLIWKKSMQHLSASIRPADGGSCC